MINKPLEAIDESALLELVANRAPESRTLEYKRDLPDTSDEGKRAYLRTISAFANTSGGDLVYGLETDNEGVPVAVSPLSVASRDQVQQRLANLSLDGVEPPLRDVSFRWVETASGAALVIRVARSWRPPHRVTAARHNQFYARGDGVTYPLDVDGLRRAFGFGVELQGRIRSFRIERIIALLQRQGPVPLIPGPLGLLHVIPLHAFASEQRIAFAADADSLAQLRPMGTSGYTPRMNIDGRLAVSNGHDGLFRSYNQLFRNGTVEAARVYPIDSAERRLYPTTYEEEVLRSVADSVRTYGELGVEAPALIFFTLLGVKGTQLSAPRDSFNEDVRADRDVLDPPGVELLSWADQIDVVVRPVFDGLWNAFGHDACMNYNPDGHWKPFRR